MLHAYDFSAKPCTSTLSVDLTEVESEHICSVDVSHMGPDAGKPHMTRSHDQSRMCTCACVRW